MHAQAVTRFTQLADASEDVPKLRANKTYRDFYLLKFEWERLKLLHEVMQVGHCIHKFYINLQTLTIDNRSQHLHNNPSRNPKTPLSGARSLFWSSCKRHGRTWQIFQSSKSSRLRFMVDWRTYTSGIIKLMTLTCISFALDSTIMTL